MSLERSRIGATKNRKEEDALSNLKPVRSRTFLLLVALMAGGVAIVCLHGTSGDSSENMPAEIEELLQRPEASLTGREKWGLDIYLRNQNETLRPLLEQARDALDEEDWETTASRVEEVVRLTPDSSLVLYASYVLLAKYYDRAGMGAKADATRKAAISRAESLLSRNLDSKWVGFCLVSLARFYLHLSSPTVEELKRCDELTQQLSSHQASTGEQVIPSPDMKLHYLALRNKQSRSAEALQLANEILESATLPHQRVAGFYGRAIAREKLGQRNAAIEDYQASLDLLMGKPDRLHSQFGAVKRVRKLAALGATPRFTSEDALARVFLRLWHMREWDALRAMWASVPDAEWATQRQCMERAPRPGKIFEVTIQPAADGKTIALARVKAGEGTDRKDSTLRFELARTEDGGFVVKNVGADQD